MNGRAMLVPVAIGAAILIGAVAFGLPMGTVFAFGMALVCPLLMMRMHGGGGHDEGHGGTRGDSRGGTHGDSHGGCGHCGTNESSPPRDAQ